MILPGTFGPNNRYTTYTNAPMTVTDFAGVEFRGLLVSDTSQAGKLVFVVVRMDTQAVIFASAPDAGSGSIGASPLGPLKVTYNTNQNKGTATESISIPDVFTPFPLGTGDAVLTYEGFLGLVRRLVTDASVPTDATRFLAEWVNKIGGNGAKWLMRQVIAAMGKVVGP